ncbi:ABC transporter permease [Rhodobacteraceae bacterium CCMM004]|nr:ABC transporter permease [Rhodobacteraceae bacterium CCMM004]
MIDEQDTPRAAAPGRVVLRRMLRHGSFTIGATLLGVIILIAIFAPLIAPHDPYATDLTNRLLPPFWHDDSDPAHLLGTDRVGRDYLSRVMYGAQVSLVIGFLTVIISCVIGSLIGVAAGYFGGPVDALVTYILTTRLSLPLFLVALAIVALSGSSLTTVILVLGFFLWDQFAVVTRSVTQQLRSQDYVKAARAMGASHRRIIFRELLPNLREPLLVVATVEMANAIILEASLSFLGFGVQAPLPSWGLMLSDAREFMFFDPWLMAIPGCALFVLLLAINFTGDGLRDVTGRGASL